MVSEAIAGGASVLTGGGRPPERPVGYFYQPTVITDIADSARLFNEEIFAPVMPIIPFDDTDEALSLANHTEYGLAAFVQTSDLNTALRLSERLDYGMVCINDWLPATPEAPFGGVNQSGIGRECGLEGFADYLESKTVFIGGVQ
jgi:acyl-CoA reductase-like NAD-dependent aldehyde dehydrogenase